MGTERLTIKELFVKEDKYIIPIYQRNYAWQEAQVTQLVIDIADYAKENKDKNYYIGTLVVYEKVVDGKNYFEVIDGQQRLTTLAILMSVLKHEYERDNKFNSILDFESRKLSKDTINFMHKSSILNTNEDINTTIQTAYKNLKTALKKIELSITNFEEYLLEKVIILRVNVPKDTDLNHYFEIMNNRGEQLEKHEVLKAQMLNKLTNKNDQVVFDKIWEACSNMDKYVQYGFDIADRKKIFSECWDDFCITSFDDLIKEENSEEATSVQEDIDSIIKNYKTADSKSKKEVESSEQFNSIVNFQNFLLLVLQVQTKDNIALDDKRLLDIFKDYINDIDFIKEFGFNLLKIRYFFDKYIIKRRYKSESDEWSLNSLVLGTKTGYYKNTFEKSQENNKNIIMLLSMFHVSYPTLIYKHWLSASLKYLYDKTTIDSNDYISDLETLAVNFLKRFLTADENKISYYEMIFKNKEQTAKIDTTLLNRGVDVENFIFNYLDYLLWKNTPKKYKDFSFTFRSSVEHFYPQNPMDGHKGLDRNILDNFGNLCLISASKNSKLSNFSPKAKKEHYDKNKTKESIKQSIMMDQADNWDEKSIKSHADAMIDIFKKYNSYISNESI